MVALSGASDIRAAIFGKSLGILAGAGFGGWIAAHPGAAALRFGG